MAVLRGSRGDEAPPQELWGLLLHPGSDTELCPKLKEYFE